ncbi:MAG: DUF1549 domain-containing protein [Verrucomicrobia bacterium]|nr:DUF1549 domain-containing protein [Verrucomicrobiota bacterium]
MVWPVLAGAEHWAFVPPRKSPPPEVRDLRWVRNGIDRFVLARLESEGITPSPEASRSTLIRRLSLDLTGLPPFPERARAFVHDDSPGAYSRLAVDDNIRLGVRKLVAEIDARPALRPSFRPLGLHRLPRLAAQRKLHVEHVVLGNIEFQKTASALFSAAWPSGKGRNTSRPLATTVRIADLVARSYGV